MNIVWCIKYLTTGKPCHPWQTASDSIEHALQYSVINPEDVFGTYEEAVAAYIKVEQTRVYRLMKVANDAQCTLSDYQKENEYVRTV